MIRPPKPQHIFVSTDSTIQPTTTKHYTLTWTNPHTTHRASFRASFQASLAFSASSIFRSYTVMAASFGPCWVVFVVACGRQYTTTTVGLVPKKKSTSRHHTHTPLDIRRTAFFCASSCCLSVASRPLTLSTPTRSTRIEKPSARWSVGVVVLVWWFSVCMVSVGVAKANASDKSKPPPQATTQSLTLLPVNVVEVGHGVLQQALAHVAPVAPLLVRRRLGGHHLFT